MNRSFTFVSALALFWCLGPLLGCGGGEEPRFRATERNAEQGERNAGRDERAALEEEQAQARARERAQRPAEPGAEPAPPDVAAVPLDAERTPTGLASRVLRPGTGTDRPGPRDRVTVHYSGWTTDGNMFDSSRRRGQPAQFGVDQVIPGWTEGLQLMVAGEQRRFWIPANLAYEGNPMGPQGMLVFDVELISFERAPEPPAVPEDVAAPPSTAERTASGLASRVLRPGTGDRHPTASSTVEVHYSGWTTDGNMFDSSVMRGQPAQFPLGNVIPGWTEGLQLMVEGEKRRFWIPANLAYEGRPNRPQGMLVFDVELLRILN